MPKTLTFDEAEIRHRFAEDRPMVADDFAYLLKLLEQYEPDGKGDYHLPDREETRLFSYALTNYPTKTYEPDPNSKNFGARRGGTWSNFKINTYPIVSQDNLQEQCWRMLKWQDGYLFVPSAAVGYLRRLAGLAEPMKKADAPEPPEEKAPPGNGATKKHSPTDPEQRAAESYEWVCKVRPDLAPTAGKKYDRAQWEYVADNECPAYQDDNGGSMKVPEYRTWKRYVRGGQHDPTNPKSASRSSRGHGSSIVKRQDI